MRAPGRPGMPDRPPLGFNNGRPIYQGTGGGLPHEQFVYEYVGEGIVRGLDAHQIVLAYPMLSLTVQSIERVIRNKIIASAKRRAGARKVLWESPSLFLAAFSCCSPAKIK